MEKCLARGLPDDSTVLLSVIPRWRAHGPVLPTSSGLRFLCKQGELLEKHELQQTPGSLDQVSWVAPGQPAAEPFSPVIAGPARHARAHHAGALREVLLAGRSHLG